MICPFPVKLCDWPVRSRNVKGLDILRSFIYNATYVYFRNFCFVTSFVCLFLVFLYLTESFSWVSRTTFGTSAIFVVVHTMCHHSHILSSILLSSPLGYRITTENRTDYNKWAINIGGKMIKRIHDKAEQIHILRAPLYSSRSCGAPETCP